MRLLLRILFGLMILVGALLALVSPWFASNVRGYEIGRFDLLAQGNVWRPVEATLSAGDAPVLVTVFMKTSGEFPQAEDRVVLKLTVTRGGETVLTRDMTFSEGPPTKDSPQASEATYREGAGTMETVVPGAYLFSAAPADVNGIALDRVELLLHAGGLDIEPRAQPAGLLLIAAGLLGMVLAMRRLTGTRKPPPQA